MVTQLFCPPFTEPESLLPFSQNMPLNPVHTFILHYFMIRFNYSLPFATKYPKLSLSVGYPTKILKHFSTLPSFHKKQRHLSAGLFDKEPITDESQQNRLKVMLNTATWLETTT
jgi:hypothetical protein